MGTSNNEARNILDILFSHSLITYDSDTQQYSFHDLVKLFAFMKLQESSGEFRSAFLNLNKFYYYQYRNISSSNQRLANNPRRIAKLIRVREALIELIMFAEKLQSIPPSSTKTYINGTKKLIKEIEARLGIKHWVGGGGPI